MARSLARRGWRTTQPDPTVVGPLLRKAGFVGAETAAFAGFVLEEVEVNYRISGHATPARELIITRRSG